jgi:hypothetical protein
MTVCIVMVIIHVRRARTNSCVQVGGTVCSSTFCRVSLRTFLTVSSEALTRYLLPKMQRTIRGGIVTTIIIFGLLLIISSVSIAIAFVYFQRKRQRRRQFTYSLESTSDDWEPSGTGYQLFDNWPSARRNPVNNNHNDHVVVDANEHMPITMTATHR